MNSLLFLITLASMVGLCWCCYKVGLYQQASDTREYWYQAYKEVLDAYIDLVIKQDYDQDL